MKKTLLTAIAVLTIMTGCSDEPTQSQQEFKTQYEVNNPPIQQAPVNNYYQGQHQDSGMNDMITGALVGAVAANMMNSNSNDSYRESGRPRRTVVNNTVINKRYASTATNMSPKPEAPIKASYREPIKKSPVAVNPAATKAAYRTKAASSYNPTPEKATYRKKTSSGWGSSKSKSSYRKKR